MAHSSHHASLVSSKNRSRNSLLAGNTSDMRPNYTDCAEHWRAQELLRENQLQKESGLLTRTSPPPMVHEPSLAPQKHNDGVPLSPFLQLPTEIRLQIYSLLVLPRKPTDLLPSFERVTSSSDDYFDYDKKEFGTDRPITADLKNPMLLIRTIDGTRYKQRYGKDRPRGEHIRTSYNVRADRFRARCMDTTYHCVNNPRIEDQLGILRANKQIYSEVAELLYSTYVFDFDSHVEAIVPFMTDLTPYARGCIKSMRFVKRALAYEKEYDRAEWNATLRYITSASSNINLRSLELGIVCGRPGPNGWDNVPTFSSSEFKLMERADQMQWVQYLLEIKGLQELDVACIVEHCPKSNDSDGLARFIRFSASVSKGCFAEYLKGEMLTAC